LDTICKKEGAYIDPIPGFVNYAISQNTPFAKKTIGEFNYTNDVNVSVYIVYYIRIEDNKSSSM